MRHKVYGKHLGRDTNQRKALFRALVRGLVFSESIKTTEAKAKAIKPVIDRLIIQSKKADNASINKLKSYLGSQIVVDKLIDLSKQTGDRQSGFTSITKLGQRYGDGAEMVRLSLLTQVEGSILKTRKMTARKERVNVD